MAELLAVCISENKGAETLLEVTQIGKECHTRCAIFHQTG
jgi:MOSC domain-containing protein YiiM